MEAKKKPTVKTAKVLAGIKFSNPADADGRKKYPNLFDLLCPQWADGAMTRQPGRLTLKVDGGVYFVAIECPTEGLQTAIAVSSLATALEEVEKIVTASSCNWTLSWARKKKSLPTIDDLIE